MRQQLLEIPRGERAALCPVRPMRVWTLLRTNGTPTLPIEPVHLSNAFLEDYGHDYRWEAGQLRYFSRIVDAKAESVWLLLEYEDNDTP